MTRADPPSHWDAQVKTETRKRYFWLRHQVTVPLMLNAVPECLMRPNLCCWTAQADEEAFCRRSLDQHGLRAVQQALQFLHLFKQYLYFTARNKHSGCNRCNRFW